MGVALWPFRGLCPCAMIALVFMCVNGGGGGGGGKLYSTCGDRDSCVADGNFTAAD